MTAKIGIFVGTVHGNSLKVAETAKLILSKKGHKTQLYESPKLIDWTKYKNNYVLIITSTTGQGELPDNINPLFKEIQDTPAIFQINIRYGIIALGDRSYTNFCGGGKKIDMILQKYSASRIGKILFIDANEHSIPEHISKPWIENWEKLLK